MRSIGLVLVCLALASHADRVHTSIEKAQASSNDKGQQSASGAFSFAQVEHSVPQEKVGWLRPLRKLAILLLALDPAAAFQFTGGPHAMQRGHRGQVPLQRGHLGRAVMQASGGNDYLASEYGAFQSGYSSIQTEYDRANQIGPSDPNASPSAPSSERPLAPGVADQEVWNRDAEGDSNSVGAKPTLIEDSEADTFRQIAYSRRTARNYDRNKNIPDDVMADILSTAQRAPTGYNMQPYKIVVVSNPEKRDELAEGFLGGNVRRVREAPVTVIFLADLEPARLLPKVLELGRKQGLPQDFLNTVPPSILGLTAPGRFGGPRALNLATSALSPLTPLPVLSDVESWSFKNTMLVAQQMMLAASSHGVSSSPMEGFDSRRILQTLKVPITDWARYAVPLAISLGYDTDSETGKVPRSSLRFPPEEVYSKNEFGVPYKDIKPMRDQSLQSGQHDEPAHGDNGGSEGVRKPEGYAYDPELDDASVEWAPAQDTAKTKVGCSFCFG